jgi:signal transduction histidine kinase
MKRSFARIALALSLPLLVAPLAGLTWLATRSVDQQETAMRARLRESLLLEVTQTNARIGSWFTELPDALHLSAPSSGTSAIPTGAELADWKARDTLVGIPFLVDPKGAIVYPKEETKLFYWRYLNVFANEERIPVYRNIATEYETSIVAAKKEAASEIASETKSAPIVASDTVGGNSLANEILDAKLVDMPVDDGSDENMMLASKSPAYGANAARESVPAASESAPAAHKSAPTVSKSAPAAESSALRSKVAQSIFETDTAVQKQVYDLAAEEGKETLKRNVNPQIDAVNTKDSIPARSIYIESDSYFRDLISQADRGIVPRIFDNSFVLLYWEKRGEWIVGCELDMDAVREAIAARSGAPADGVRYLAVLDQSGTPLVPVANVEASVWRTPLVSGEISEYLPYWETAVILADPSAFESRVRASRYALSTLVLALFLSVALGAVFLLRYSSKSLLEAKRRTSFVTTVTHELKTPLTSIRMYSEMLADGADLNPEKRNRYIARIVSESERLTRLINDVLDVAKLERGKTRLTRVPVDLAELARSALEGVTERLEAEGFTVSCTPGDAPVLALAEREAVIRILLNLLSNAEKYSGNTREIEVTVSVDEKHNRCIASVADRGIGVPRSHRKKIFREFHRVDATLTSERGGTGLGLSIARSLARSLGGDVLYAPRDKSSDGRGSIFTLTLPAAEKKEGNR